VLKLDEKRRFAAGISVTAVGSFRKSLDLARID